LVEKYECPTCYETFDDQGRYMTHLKGHFGGASPMPMPPYEGKEPMLRPRKGKNPLYMSKEEMRKLMMRMYGVEEA